MTITAPGEHSSTPGDSHRVISPAADPGQGDSGETLHQCWCEDHVRGPAQSQLSSGVVTPGVELTPGSQGSTVSAQSGGLAEINNTWTEL